jgi:hypothetical protein
VYEISNVSEEVMRSMTIGKNAGSNVALDVYGNAYITGSLTVTGTISGAVGGVSGTTNYIPKFTSTTAIGNSLIYDNGTNVGIGTTSPSTKLEVNGNTTLSGFLNVYGNLDGATLPGNGSTTAAGIIGWNRSGGGGEMNFINAKGAGSLGGFRWQKFDGSTLTNLMDLSSAGSLSIGKITPTATLDVNGSAIITGSLTVGSSGPALVLDTKAASDGRMEFKYNGTREALIGVDLNKLLIGGDTGTDIVLYLEEMLV